MRFIDELTPHDIAERLYGVLDRRLNGRDYIVGDYSVADIALYAYTHVAGDGGFELDRFPSVVRWLAAVAAQPGHVRITDEVGQPVAWT